MGNFKVKVNSESESREVQELFFELGYRKGACSTGFYPAVIIATPFSEYTKNPFSSRAIEINSEAYKDFKEITLAELRAMVNDQYAEIQQVRQAVKDNVNHPSHYTQGKVECIDALESATIGKSGIEAVCVANVIKYLWRYEEKNGLEDVKKAQWYLERLVASMGS